MRLRRRTRHRVRCSGYNARLDIGRRHGAVTADALDPFVLAILGKHVAVMAVLQFLITFVGVGLLNGLAPILTSLAPEGGFMELVPERLRGEIARFDITDKDGKIKFEYDIDKNQDIAKNLKGHLLLITGDIDNNVHPSNTYRVIDALIKANKRFDFILLPGQRHGYAAAGGAEVGERHRDGDKAHREDRGKQCIPAVDGARSHRCRCRRAGPWPGPVGRRLRRGHLSDDV